MSYHTHNLERGDVFFAPADLRDLNDDNYWSPGENTRWRVTSARPYGRGHLVHVAEVDKPWNRTSAVLNSDISLCMDEDYVRPRARLKWWARTEFKKRTPEIYYALFPRRRPGAVALRNAIFMAGPAGQLVKALEAGGYNGAVLGAALVIESLSSVMERVTFDATSIRTTAKEMLT